MDTFDVGVIGGGASGLMAAIEAARAGAKVVVLEKSDRVGKKILATGNGRCNLSNESICLQSNFHEYYNHNFARITLSAYNHDVVMNVFYLMGLMTKSDEHGWTYPLTKSANSVLNVLLLNLELLGVQTRCNAEVKSIEFADETYHLKMNDGASVRSKSVIIATAVSPLLATIDKLTQAPRQAILGSMETTTDSLKGLDGVRVSCNIALYHNEQIVHQEFGQVQFKKTGLSGIAVFQLSRLAKVGDKLALDFLPDQNIEHISAFFLALKANNPHITAYMSLLGVLHKQLALSVLKSADVAHDKPLDGGSAKLLARTLKSFCFNITALPRAKDAQVMRGGLDVSGFNPKTLESLHYERLFACGEALDVDGFCGGYNLHWAWASGLSAGKAAAAVGAPDTK